MTTSGKSAGVEGFAGPDPAERSAFNRMFYAERAPILQEYVRVASSGRKHFPLPAGAPLAEYAAIASQYRVYRSEVPSR